MTPCPPPRTSVVAALFALALVSLAGAQPPLHQRIDQALAPGASQLAKPAGDEEFLRRIYLDLTGTIPSIDDTRAFLKDSAPDKRAKLIDRLLASPEHARHLAHVFDVMLMERRPAKNVPAAAWHDYLREAFAANKPWDELARDILSADGADPKKRAPARFYLDREGEPHLITRDVSRVFLGTNFQCAQCHDHPLIDDYKQEQYYGLFAFLNRSQLFTDRATRQVVLAEKADGEVTFQSVFDPAKVTKSSGPRVPGRPAVKESPVKKGEEYTVKPAANVRGVPKYSRRALLGGELARADNVAFRRNLANRLWALMMGRGIVHPVDLDHSRNPPSQPALLDLLTAEVGTRKFDVRSLLREIALSQAYQRSSAPPPGAGDVLPGRFAVASLKPLSPEALAFSLFEAAGMTAIERRALGKGLTEAALYPRVVRQVQPLINSFASQPGTAQEFEPTLDQALFLSNGPLLRGWLTPRSDNLLDRLQKLSDDGAVAEEAYLSVLTRRPTDEEKKEVADYLKTAGKPRPQALQELAWALLTSAEFRFNH